MSDNNSRIAYKFPSAEEGIQVLEELGFSVYSNHVSSKWVFPNDPRHYTDNKRTTFFDNIKSMLGLRQPSAEDHYPTLFGGDGSGGYLMPVATLYQDKFYYDTNGDQQTSHSEIPDGTLVFSNYADPDINSNPSFAECRQALTKALEDAGIQRVEEV